MNVLVFDLETENHIYNKRKASPWHPENYIVQIGWSINGLPAREQYYSEFHRDPVLPCLDDIDILVAHNAKFDLLWTWREPELMKFFKRGGRIWCTQYTEYLLEGMLPHAQMNALNDVAMKYGGSMKIDAVKEMWESGILTSQIDQQLLTDYLIGDGKEVLGDIENTWRVFLGQVAAAKERGEKFLQMLRHRMDGLLATTEMEYNGMYIDEAIAEEDRVGLLADIALAKEELEQYIPDDLPEEFKFNWGSSQMKSALIFGGTLNYQKFMPHLNAAGDPIYPKKKVPFPLFGGVPVNPTLSYVKEIDGQYCIEADGQRYWQDLYKGGKQAGMPKSKLMDVPDTSKKPKGRLTPIPYTFPGHTKPHPAWKNETVDALGNPLYSTSSEVIEKLAERNLPFTNALAKWVGKSKDLSTFYYVGEGDKRKGLLTLVEPTGIIHHSLNHTGTVTSRMSSSNPNMQNIPRGTTSNVKRMFCSRWGGGKMVEIDYSQLEVVVTGILTHDPQLLTDLNDGVDFHCKRLAAVRGETYEHVWKQCHEVEDPTYKAGRQKAKIFSFQRAYGAGAAKIAASTGMQLAEVEELIEAEDRLYPYVGVFYRRLEKIIHRHRYTTDDKLYVDGVQFAKGYSYWDCPTGTRYTWQEGITPVFMHDRGRYTGFSPTEIKNYPVQGTGGEIVQTILGKVWRHFVANDYYNGDIVLVNSVHDCIQLDCKSDAALSAIHEIHGIMESVPDVYNTAYPELNITVPFPCEADVGANLLTMHKYI